MLNDHDRRALEDIERHLASEDPALRERLTRQSRPFPTVLVLCACFYIAAPLAKLLFGWAGLEIAAASFAAAVVAVLVHRRRR
ncbi:hypothetical protein Ade02nite_17620 [Paractinoplanes deccanensis]|uniref:DUF3040 domain-containing protein n=1 Tax=Paractinoplanes deccanensis TaxID=113561 RepID=A0ABQ3XZD5_9ACTN|nr:DUF3040 domain-containing protein [Actinoplanes deccanensis]GID73121.1 hypothetical protein Ade02nite_17620 [Actinoplanes deccanensis]